MAAKAPDVVGIAEVARLAGVAKQTVSSWVSRGTTPPMPPHTLLRAGPVWNRTAVERWIVTRTRYIPGNCSDCQEQGKPCGR
jgi:hypothetical protein